MAAAVSTTAPTSQAAAGRWVRVTSRGSASTLWGIASAFYGRGALWPRVWAANRTRVHDPDLILTGQLLWVPARVGAMTASRSTNRPPPAPTRTATPAPAPSGRAETAIRFALAQVGDAYRWAGTGPYSWDCSGLVMVAFSKIGVRLPHQSGEMLAYGRRVSRSELRRGDVVWPQYGHVAIYLGQGRIVHAANPRSGVIESSLYGFYAARRMT